MRCKTDQPRNDHSVYSGTHTNDDGDDDEAIFSDNFFVVHPIPFYEVYCSHSCRAFLLLLFFFFPTIPFFNEHIFEFALTLEYFVSNKYPWMIDDKQK